MNLWQRLAVHLVRKKRVCVQSFCERNAASERADLPAACFAFCSAVSADHHDFDCACADARGFQQIAKPHARPSRIRHASPADQIARAFKRDDVFQRQASLITLPS